VIADLHCHYAMHLLESDQQPRLRHVLRRGLAVKDRARALVMWIANRVANFRKWSSGPRVTLDRLQAGDVRLVVSVLYVPFSEMDLGLPYGAPPTAAYAGELLAQLQRVEDDLREQDPAGTRHVIAKRAPDLDGDRIAFVHCVEGGFHLGATPHDIDAQVTALARRGVVYITLAHLFWRRVATNSPALPFLSDRWYDRLFPQPADGGLSELGIAAVKAMARERVLVDVSHMRDDAITQTLALLDEEAPGFPVIASHAGVRFPKSSQRYQLADDTVRRIGERDGVIGLILAQHQLNDGIRTTRTRHLQETIDVICRHIDRIEELSGPGHVGLGTDFDGFIKPTMGGLQTASDLVRLREPLLARYDAAQVDAFLHGNARRVIQSVLAARAVAH
jgi:microsomal dipeptidase-like Zn-dependent dipeptidase